MVGSYEAWLVVLSVGIACFASYVALDLAARVAAARGRLPAADSLPPAGGVGSLAPSGGRLAAAWLAGGALSMGIGIWSMHFIGMLAFRLPVPLAYDPGITVLSLLIAVGVSGYALHTVSRGVLGVRRLLGAGTLMGAGIAAMHYSGMAAMQMQPAVQYKPLLLVLSLLIAIGASVIALWSAFTLRAETIFTAFWRRCGGALVLGGAIAGMHYTGMAAAVFAPDAVCTAGPRVIDSAWLAGAVGGFTGLLLSITLLVSVVDERLAGRAARNAASLSAANQALEARSAELLEANALLEEQVAARQRAEEHLNRLARAREVTAECNRVVTYASDETQMLRDTCRVFVESGGYKMAWVGMLVHDEGRSIEPVASAGDDGYLASLMPSWGDNEFGQGPAGMAGRTGLPQVTQRIETNPGLLHWRPVALARGYQAAAALPLICEGRILGVISIYSSAPDAFSPEEFGLLTDLSHDIAFAFSNLRARAARALAETELQRLYAELELRVAERTAQITEANRELEAFSYTVSHDLRAPLRHIVGFAQLLGERRDALDAEMLKYLDVITKSATRMETLINDLLSLSRTSRAEPMFLDFDLGPLVQDVKNELMQGAAGRDIRWEIGALPKVRADPRLLRIALVNLMGNAFKFTGHSDPAVIAIDAQSGDGGEVVLHVRDNGAGFDMAYADKLFGVFQRLHSEADFAGTGIGLATVRRVIKRLGGQVWAVGEVGKGATFSVSLKAAGTGTAAAAPAAPALSGPSVTG